MNIYNENMTITKNKNSHNTLKQEKVNTIQGKCQEIDNMKRTRTNNKNKTHKAHKQGTGNMF